MALAGIFSLSAKADISDRKCGTFGNNKNEILKQIFTPSSFKGDELQSREYDVLPMKYTSPSKQFYIHYAVEGEHAVDITDADKNGIPDYIDSVAYYIDFSYNYEISKLGFRIPPKDGNQGGNDLYDIYVAELGRGTGYYGLTENEGPYSYIVIDNNFSPSDSSINPRTNKLEQSYNTFGIQALKVTLAHEYNHSIQFGYSQKLWNLGVFAEMSSVLIEYLVFPEEKDYVYYMRKFISNLPNYSLFSSDANNGYLWATLFIKLYETYHDAGFAKTLWEKAEICSTSYEIINETLKGALNTNLDRELIDMAEWLYHTNSKINPKYYVDKHFQDSKLLTDLKFIYNHQYSAPSVMYSSSIYPYTYFPVRVTFPASPSKSADTLDFFLINLNKKNINYYDLTSDNFNFSISDNANLSCETLVVNKKYCYEIKDNSIIFTRFFEAAGQDLVDNNDVFPMPYTGETDYIAFPLDLNTLETKVHLSIYNVDNYCVFAKVINIGVVQNTKAAIWYSIPGDLRNGIYLYKLEIGNETKIGKFAVEKKNE